jgi:hypothetical protein
VPSRFGQLKPPCKDSLCCPNRTVLYTGNGGTNVITGVGFAPDFVWIKGRTINIDHAAFDSVRGATKYISPSTTGAEGTYSTVLNAFGSDGFTVGSNAGVNSSSSTYVSWNFKAGAAAVNGTGTNAQNITYSANPDAGFSIVKFSTNGSTSYTATHGLNQAPELVLSKVTSVASNWLVYSSSLGISQYMNLDTTAQALTYSNLWNGMSSTHIGGSNAAYGGTNTFVNYCFHSVDGYQKVGSYTGNATTNVVTTGFQPKFLLVKASSHASSWYVIDSERTDDKFLSPNLSNAEYTDANKINFTSTGFTLTSTSYNNSGYTWIYLAIA